MKLGYSILLGETLDASALQYRDCERFQVVCPNCHEPIFKVRRAAETPDECHFFAHYAASKAYQGNCDLRVKSYSRVDLEAQNQVSRDQRLSYFLSVLKRTLGMAPNYLTTAERTHYRLEKSPAFLFLRDMCWGNLAQADSGEAFDVTVEDYLYRLKDVGWELTTTFSLDRQRKIARDMWQMIMTPAGHGNFNFVFNHAWLLEFNAVIARMDEHDADDIVVMRQVASYMAAVLEAKKGTMRSLLQEMASRQLPRGYNVIRGQAEDDEPSTFLTRILGNVTIQMVGALMEVPYFELLKQQYGDPSKVYPYQPGIAPVDDEEVARMRAYQEKHLSSRVAH